MRKPRGETTEQLLDLPTILAALDVRPGWTVLDAGCGTGYMARRFAPLVGEGGAVYALDPDAGKIAALEHATVGTVIRPIRAPITRPTPLAAAFVDLIYLSTVVHIFDDAQFAGFLAEAGRLLKPGGKLAIVEIRKGATPYGPPLSMRVSAEELRERIAMRPTATVDVGECFYMQVFENVSPA